MGILRLLLAVSVVIAHSGPVFGLTLVGGGTAVQVFFIISGFYMGLILNRKYTGPGSYRLFIGNRLLRLLPVFFVCLAVAAATEMLIYRFGHAEAYAGRAIQNTVTFLAENASRMSIADWLLAAGTNILILGRSAMAFLVPGAPTLAPFLAVPVPVGQTLHGAGFLPQAWSLDHELLFYLMAPLLARRSWPVILAATVLAAGWRLGVQAWARDQAPGALDALSYFLFPSQLVFFFLGLLVYRIYERIEGRHPPRLGLLLAALLVGYIVAFPWLPGAPGLKSNGLYMFAAAVIPFAFDATRRLRADVLIGELSYPVYLSHTIAIQLLLQAGLGDAAIGPAAVAAAVAISVVLYLTMVQPIERLRQGRVVAADAVF